MIILLFALCWRDIHLLLNAWRSAISIPCAISCPTLNVRSCATSPELQDACKQGFIQVQKLTFDHYNLAILVKHRVDQTTLICNFHFFTSSWYKMATQWGWGAYMCSFFFYLGPVSLCSGSTSTRGLLCNPKLIHVFYLWIYSTDFSISLLKCYTKAEQF